MKLPRNVFGRDLANHLIRYWSYREDRQNGSHIVLLSTYPPTVQIVVPAHKPLKVGTLQAILRDVASDRGVTIADILHRL